MKRGKIIVAAVLLAIAGAASFAGLRYWTDNIRPNFREKAGKICHRYGCHKHICREDDVQWLADSTESDFVWNHPYQRTPGPDDRTPDDG